MLMFLIRDSQNRTIRPDVSSPRSRLLSNHNATSGTLPSTFSYLVVLTSLRFVTKLAPQAPSPSINADWPRFGAGVRAAYRVEDSLSATRKANARFASGWTKTLTTALSAVCSDSCPPSISFASRMPVYSANEIRKSLNGPRAKTSPADA